MKERRRKFPLPLFHRTMGEYSFHVKKRCTAELSIINAVQNR